MEFNTYIGRAGTGKSTAMLNQIKNKMKQDPLGDPIVLIAPTQSTFQLNRMNDYLYLPHGYPPKLNIYL